MTTLVFDKDGNPVPSREFLSMVIIMLRKAEQETGKSLTEWLVTTGGDPKDNVETLKAVREIMNEHYPTDPPPLNPADFLDEDDDEMPEIAPAPDQPFEYSHADSLPIGHYEPGFDADGNLSEVSLITDDDEDDLPIVQRLSE